jgi:hypothetical protein
MRHARGAVGRVVATPFVPQPTVEGSRVTARLAPVAPSTPPRAAPAGACPDPQLVLSTIVAKGVGNVSWTFLVTGDCPLSRLDLNVRLATDRTTDAQCFTADTLRRVTGSDVEWSDLACEQIGYPPNNDLIEGWWFEPSRIPQAARETRLTIVRRSAPAGPPGLPEPAGLLFTWSWDGGPPTTETWDALPILGRSSAPDGDTITRALPLAR